MRHCRPEASVLGLALLLLAACRPALSQVDLKIASERLGCPAQQLRSVEVTPGSRKPAPRHTGDIVYRVDGCGRSMRFQSVCTPTASCTFRPQDRPSPVAPSTSKQPPEVAEERLGEQLHASNRPLTTAQNFARSYQSTVVVRAGENLGSGFAVSRDGLLVSNLHVVAGASEIGLHFVDGLKGEVLWVEAYSEVWDLVLLRGNRNLHALPLDAHDRVGIGQDVIAIGSPLGFEATVSAGIVSGLRQREGVDVVQITAPISPGSSGGPILNAVGEVIAVSTFGMKGGNSLGFGIPAKYVRSLLTAPTRIALSDFAAQTARIAEAARDAASPP